ncbi:hypothetical protein D3C85_1832830 [compost metagenome]
MKRYVRFGAGPRALQAIVAVSKVRALCSGKLHVSWSDIREVAVPALRHRVVLGYEAQAAGITTDQMTESILNALELTR